MGRASLVTYGLVFFVLESVIASDHWSYPDRNHTNEFPQWGGLCDTGYLQSPIDLSVSNALKAILPDFDFRGYDKSLTLPTLSNNGHTVKLKNFNVEMTFSGGPLPDKFIVEEVHLHWWSEHTLDKIRYPMEAHIVHRNTRYENITEASKHKNGIAVLGILFHASNEANVGIRKIVENIRFISSADEIDKPIKVEQNLNLREFFPKLSSGYLTYPGSLTTPSCAESVIWIVLLDTFPVTLEQVNEFRSIQTYGGKKLSDNYRNEQKKYNRPVLVVRPDHQKSSGPETFRFPKFVLLASVLAIVLFK